MPSTPTRRQPPCSICGNTVGSPAAGSVPNPVCAVCDGRAETDNGRPATSGEPIAWFAPGPTGEPLQVRAAPDSGAALEAFFDQFDSSTAFRIVGAESTAEI